LLNKPNVGLPETLNSLVYTDVKMTKHKNYRSCRDAFFSQKECETYMLLASFSVFEYI